MFVFPAFNSNYNDRKRRFKSCRKCRAKRVKCNIELADYESVGCINCREAGVDCDLIKGSTRRLSQESVLFEPPADKPDTSGKDRISRPRVMNSHDSQSKPSGLLSLEKMVSANDMKEITWLFLKQNYGFTLTLSRSKYELSSLPMAQRNSNHEFDVIDKQKVFSFIKKSLTEHLKNPYVFHFLKLIHAFTINTPGKYEIIETRLKKLFKIYFYKVNSIFPLVLESEFWKDYEKNRVPNILSYAILIAIARDELARPILQQCFLEKLDQDPETNYYKNLQNFLTDMDLKCRQVMAILPELGDTDPISRMVTHLLLTFHFNYHKLGSEQNSHDLTDAVNYGLAAMIHFRNYHDRLLAAGEVMMSTYLRHLWWCAFVMDRINGMMNSKAMFIKRHDFNIDRPEAGSNLSTLVDIAMRLEDMMVANFRPKDHVQNRFHDMDEMEQMFDPDEINKKELQLSETAEPSQVFNEYKKHRNEGPTEDFLPQGVSVARYSERMIYFMERGIANLIVLSYNVKLGKTDPKSADLVRRKVVSSVMRYFQFLTDNRGYELMLNYGLIPLMMSLLFSLSLVHRLRVASVLNLNNDSDRMGYETMIEITSLWDDYLREIEALSRKWFFIQEVMISIKNLDKSMNRTVGLYSLKYADRAEDSNEEEHDAKRRKLVDENTRDNLLPVVPSLSSSAYHTTIISRFSQDLPKTEETPATDEFVSTDSVSSIDDFFDFDALLQEYSTGNIRNVMDFIRDVQFDPDGIVKV